MYTYIALLRGINIAGNNPLPMRDLVRLLESMGCQDVRTYIQSGNVVFRTRKGPARQLTEAISARIGKLYGFKPTVLLLSAAALKKAITHNPFSTADGRALHFLFLASRPKQPDLAGLMAIKSNTEQFKLVNKVFYLYAPDGVGRSKLVARIEPALGVPVTGRNWNTITKLMTMVEQA